MTEYKKLPLDIDGNLIENNFMLQCPTDLVIVSFPKSGKTLSMVNTPKILIGDPEGGTDYFAAKNVANILTYDGSKEFVPLKNGIYIPAGIYETVQELRKANKMKEYWELRTKLGSRIPEKEKEQVLIDLIAHINGIPFPIYATDTVTFLQELNFKASLTEYNDRFMIPKGKDPKTDIKKVDDYGGAQYIRNNFLGIKRYIEQNSAPFKIWTGHIKEKKALLNKSQDEVSGIDMALEGQLSTIFTSRANAVCTFYRNDDGCFLDFEKKKESDLGSRPMHLSNKVIKIADELKDGELYPTTYWKKIYPELNF